MSFSDDEDNLFARFLESEMSLEDDEEEPKPKRQCLEKDKENAMDGDQKEEDRNGAKTMMESAGFSKVPIELLHHILKYLSSEDLVTCSLVCKSLNFAASDDSLWRCLYTIRWGPTSELRECSWKKLYIDRDKEDIDKLVRSCGTDFYYIQMQTSKRSQAPLPSEMVDDCILIDETVPEQVSMWKKSMGLNDKFVRGHCCSGASCSYHQIGDRFICIETGNVHVCGDNCKEARFCKKTLLYVCAISGHCLLPVDQRALLKGLGNHF